MEVKNPNQPEVSLGDSLDAVIDYQFVEMDRVEDDLQAVAALLKVKGAGEGPITIRGASA